MNPLVSISCISFNHASYIRQCLEGMLMQQTDFPFEIVIHDDASTDGTAEILKEYASKYPDRIFPMFQHENQYGKGVRALMARFNFPRCRGKYIALCEGDDFWTDRKKLQKQFQYLEQHPERSICFHDMKVVDGEGRTIQEHTNDGQVPQSGIMDLAEKGNFIWTASVMFRKNDKPYPDWYYDVPIGDYPMHLIHAGYGNIGFIPEVMGAYRLHDAGTLGLKSKTEVLAKWLVMLEQIKDKFSIKVNEQLNQQFLDTLYRSYLEYAGQGDKGKATISIQRIMDLDPCFLLRERERLEAKITSLKNSRLLTLSQKINQVKEKVGLKVRK
jgi:glycosyltransferase involved in cell wall biosynthesis